MKFSTASQALVSMKFTESASRSNQVRMSAFHVRRDKAALFQWVQAPPGDRSSRKRPEQAWRRRSV